MKKLIGLLLIGCVIAHAESITHGTTTINMDFVNIGYAGNVADTRDGDSRTDGIQNYGAVSYDYRIGKYEVSVDQFAKAYVEDSRVGSGDENYWESSPHFTPVGPNAPACNVTWYEAAKFTNWLTSGDAHTGVYQFDSSGTLIGIDRTYRNGNELAYVLPTEDEWYKAAYYKPADNGSYSSYSSGLDTLTPNAWNTIEATPYPHAPWEVNFGVEEQNGTLNMLGNVAEWNESAQDGTLDNLDEHRVYRGGGYAGSVSHLLSSGHLPLDPTNWADPLGFRVAAIPEPSSTAMMAVVSGCAVVVRRWFLI